MTGGSAASLVLLVQEPWLQRALFGGLCLAIAAAPLGVFLVMRRMSLVVDAVGHAILPGAAGAVALGAGSTLAISAGAAATGAGVFALAGWASRLLRLPEDSGFAVFYLGALSMGVVVASAAGTVDLERLMFGAILALDTAALVLCTLAVVVAWAGTGILYRPLLADTMDADWLSASQARKVRAGFFALLAVVTVASFHALGALMAVGLTVLPAIAARHWSDHVWGRVAAATVLGCVGVVGGLGLSLSVNVAAGPSIVLVLTGLVLASAIAGPHDSLISRRGAARLLA